ncbi:uncharacterized protein [Clytia hemisphaerica]|uniref:uncharacterized protein n=1 Tax=Clytia hemisphaerica TaxID=252671 RepID=UPI0034D4FB24
MISPIINDTLMVKRNISFNDTLNRTTAQPPLSTTLLPPRRLKPYSNEFRIILLFLYCILLICGLLGNLMTCVAVITVKTMRRSIHFYIFNLAVADLLLLLLYVPTQMIFVRDYMSWTMGKDMCIIAFGIICLCLSASIGTLIAISIDRYTGLMRPFDWRAASTRTSKIVIPIIWLMSAATAAPLAYHGNVGRNNDGSMVCYEDWSLREMVIYWTTIMVLQYILPLILISGVHIHMAIIVSRQQQEAINELHKRMIRMVIMLLFTYSICNGMQHINFYLSVYLHIHNESFGSYLFLFSNFAISLQAAINPLIYGISRNDYKDVFKRFFKSYTLEVMKVVCRIQSNEQSPTNSNSTDVQSTSMLLETPQMLKKNFQTTTSFLVTNNNNAEIFELAPDTATSSPGLKQNPSSPYLQIPKRQTRKISLRFDTLRYMPDQDSNMTRTRSSTEANPTRARTRTRSNAKKQDTLADEMVPQLITSNQNHPIIVITDYEKNDGDPEGKYGTIREYDYTALERPSDGHLGRAVQKHSMVPQERILNSFDTRGRDCNNNRQFQSQKYKDNDFHTCYSLPESSISNHRSPEECNNNDSVPEMESNSCKTRPPFQHSTSNNFQQRASECVKSDFDFSWSMINPNSRESVIISLLENANESRL